MKFQSKSFPLSFRLQRFFFAAAALLMTTYFVPVQAQMGSIEEIDLYDPMSAYPTPGTKVRYVFEQDGVLRGAIFYNAWYINPGVIPTFYPGSSGWVKDGPTLLLANAEDLTGDIEFNPPWHPEAAYTGGNIVAFESVCYRAKWWTKGDTPTMEDSPWEIVLCEERETVVDPNSMIVVIPTDDDMPVDDMPVDDMPVADVPVDDMPVDDMPVADVPVDDMPGDDTSADPNPSDAIPTWHVEGTYPENSVVKHNGVCYKTNWWIQGREPRRASELANVWDSPWQELESCDGTVLAAPTPGGGSGAVGGVLDKMPMAVAVPRDPSSGEDEGDTEADMKATEEAAKVTDSLVTPVIPPVVPQAQADIPLPPPATSPPPTTLPDDGYEFLRQVTKSDWDWMFPLRSGKYVSAANGGATRNLHPVAKPDGSTDTFTLDAFIKATLVYNTWAQTYGYRQFLNEGTVKQQAEEFLVFWAKSARETSGSWSDAKSPWIEVYEYGGEAIVAWKGALYWVEEAAYAGSTDPKTGKSSLLNYIDVGSTEYPPAPGRSYYGRGIIQLSWNYNYGPFSYWLFDNGLLPDIITERDILLRFPNLVADHGELSILSGIWFWMTPQGAKPASQDVMLGLVTNISRTSQERGLPQTRDVTPYVPAVEAGETSNPEVFAYRLGTVINIVNGGLECNGAAKWHDGPRHRVSYYNAYAAYFNDKLGVGATRLPEATNVWDIAPTSESDITHQSATCWNQKQYYGW